MDEQRSDDARETAPAAVDAFLSDRNPAKKSAALAQLRARRDWPATTVERVIAIARADPIAFLRRDAVLALSAAFHKTSDRKILGSLAAIVEDPAERSDVRGRAYLGLISVSGRGIEGLPITERGGRMTLELDRMLDRADWVYVRACAADATSDAGNSS